MTFDFQTLEESCPASRISVKDENCVPGKTFQDVHLLGAQFGSQKADRVFETGLVQCQNVKIAFDYENGVVRDSELLQAEQDPSFVERGGVGGVYILCLRRAIDSAPTESYSGASLVREGKDYSPHEWAGYSLFLLFQESNAEWNFLLDPGLLEGGNEIFDGASISKRELLLGLLVDTSLCEIVHRRPVGTRAKL